MPVLVNLGAGKIDFSRFENYHIVVNVDRCYAHGDDIRKVEDKIINCPDMEMDRAIDPVHYFIGMDLFDFLDDFRLKIDAVNAERIFEHMEYCSGEVGRLLEAINMITKPKCKLDIVVPNAETLSRKLLDYEANSKNYNHTESLNTKLIINSEFCNIKADPHGSVWTPVLAHEYIESEGTWIVDNIIPVHPFAGRDIYMKIECSKPQSKEQ